MNMEEDSILYCFPKISGWKYRFSVPGDPLHSFDLFILDEFYIWINIFSLDKQKHLKR